MKKKNIWLILPAVALVFGMLVVGCGEPSPTKFEGKWVNLQKANNSDFTDYSFTFTGNKWSFISDGHSDPDQNGSYNGTFTFTDTKIKFKFGNTTWEQGYTLSGDVLELEEPTTVDFAYGSFKKQ